MTVSSCAREEKGPQCPGQHRSQRSSPEIIVPRQQRSRFLPPFTRAQAQTGAVTLIQRFGSAANLNIHLHCIMLDGVYRLTDGAPVFHTVPPPTPHELQTLLARIIKRVLKLLTRKGALMEDAPESLYLADSEHDPAVAPLHAAASTYRIALGPRAGQKVLTWKDPALALPSQKAHDPPQGCVSAHGFSINLGGEK